VQPLLRGDPMEPAIPHNTTRQSAQSA
jgi:hypothetical protein